jgi:hypothetical protein
MAGVALVDRKGRKFLLSVGTAGIIASLLVVGTLFQGTEKLRVDCRAAVQALVAPDQHASVAFNQAAADQLLASAGGAGRALAGKASTLVVIYSYGDFRTATSVVRSDDPGAKPVEITRAGCLPPNKVVAFFSNPFADLDAARAAPLKIENALITPIPSERNGWITAFAIFGFMAFFAIGPGVCVWLALSELMPTRIRSNGMSIALLINQAVSTTIAAVFLPTVGRFGYSTMFFTFAGCTVVYFITAAFFLPETKGRTLEEIEAMFEGAPRGADATGRSHPKAGRRLTRPVRPANGVSRPAFFRRAFLLQAAAPPPGRCVRSTSSLSAWSDTQMSRRKVTNAAIRERMLARKVPTSSRPNSRCTEASMNTITTSRHAISMLSPARVTACRISFARLHMIPSCISRWIRSGPADPRTSRPGNGCGPRSAPSGWSASA